jgi:uncharacterized protein (TIGR02757 family)
MVDQQNLDSLYRKYNKRKYVDPDPLVFLYEYPLVRDREIAAFIASALAYGRVKQILKSVSNVLAVMGTSPFLFLQESSSGAIQRKLKGFVHRFSTGESLSSLLIALKRVIQNKGSLEQEFYACLDPSDDTILQALGRFCERIHDAAPFTPGHLLPLPSRGSACKRLNLFLRWMVRKDDVDPGGWERIAPAMLIIPLDVHMHRMGHRFGFTARKQADMKTALEVTKGFRKIVPNDPVRYDFTLTRLGIRNDICEEDFFDFF